jgi:hypothetical protein
MFRMLRIEYQDLDSFGDRHTDHSAPGVDVKAVGRRVLFVRMAVSPRGGASLLAGQVVGGGDHQPRSDGIDPSQLPEVATFAQRLAPKPPRQAPPSPRPGLIAEALAFTREASRLPGVIRIALIGSLVTYKDDPKDADLLLTVADDADLAPLARLGRRLQGHAQSMGLGADVFLVDVGGAYLGRTCRWRDCRPGIRMSCDAIHCGRRPHLHDDLGVIRLDPGLIAAPPVELWPQPRFRVPVPDDVREGLIEPLGG